MGKRKHLSILLPVLLLSLAPAIAEAAPRPNNPPVLDTEVDMDAEGSEGVLAEAARNMFAEGVRWYRRKKYNQALAAFLQAYALTKNPAVLVNLGQTHLRLNHPLDAIKLFEQFLNEAKDASPDRRKRVEQSLAEARKMVGRIDVSAPEGSEISVDGQVVGKSPLPAPIDVLPGRHEVAMSSANGSKSESVEVEKGAKLEIRLIPPRVPTRPSPAPSSPKVEGAPPEAPGILSPPSVVAPTYVAGAIGIAALTTAIVLNGIRVNADRNASTATEALVRGNKDPASCSDPVALSDAAVASACGTVRESKRIMDKTSDAFTISLWTGVGATAAALAWYLLAPKEGAAAARGRAPVTVTPLVGAGGSGTGGMGGASIFGSF